MMQDHHSILVLAHLPHHIVNPLILPSDLGNVFLQFYRLNVIRLVLLRITFVCDAKMTLNGPGVHNMLSCLKWFDPQSLHRNGH